MYIFKIDKSVKNPKISILKIEFKGWNTFITASDPPLE